ncbi:TVP38/TMEM64 family protein, partial [Megasphaera massiliensis]|nr:TVP38/TMEM64 family protein [Megasphaera massiliensis]
MLPDRIHETHLKIDLFLALLIIFGGIHLLIPDLYATDWDLSMSGNLHGTIDYLRSFRGWAFFISMIINIVINVVGFLPSIFISTANGVVFG